MDYQIDDMALATCEKRVEEWEDFEPYHGPQVMTKKPTVSIPISAIGATGKIDKTKIKVVIK